MLTISTKDLGAYIAERRKALGVSQRSLAMALGYSPQSLSLFEKGKIAPSVSVIPKLADSLECSIGDLLLLTPEPKSGYENPPFDQERFARRIRTLRSRAGMTQAEAAKALGISLRTLRNYESGRSTPTTDFLYSAASTYKIQPQFLFIEDYAAAPVSEPPSNKGIGKRRLVLIIIGAIIAAMALVCLSTLLAVSLLKKTYMDANGKIIGEKQFFAEEVPEINVSLNEAEYVTIGMNEFHLKCEDETFFARHNEYIFTWSAYCSEPAVSIQIREVGATGFSAYVSLLDENATYHNSLVVITLILEDSHDNKTSIYSYPCFLLVDEQIYDANSPDVIGFTLPVENEGEQYLESEIKGGTTYTFDVVYDNPFSVAEDGLYVTIAKMGLVEEDEEIWNTTLDVDTTSFTYTPAIEDSGDDFVVIGYAISGEHRYYNSPLTFFSVI